MVNYYQVLGISIEASSGTVKKAYREKVVKCHPDKVPGMEDEFNALSLAYATLSDPYKKARYDISIAKGSSAMYEHDPRMQTMKSLRKVEAETEVELMKHTYDTIVNLETLRNGLVIVKAVYGILHDHNYKISDTCIDVKIPLQCMVKDSILCLIDGTSKQELEGLYNPLPHNMSNLRLRVLYSMNEMLHEVEIEDYDELSIPQRQHALAYHEERAISKTQGSKRIFNSRNYDQIRKEQQRKQLFWYSILASATFCMYLVSKRR